MIDHGNHRFPEVRTFEERMQALDLFTGMEKRLVQWAYRQRPATREEMAALSWCIEWTSAKWLQNFFL